MILNELTPARTRPITTCPRCGSIEIESIHPIANLDFDEAVANAWTEHRFGRTGQGLRVLLRWACVQTANSIRSDRYLCSHCEWAFREGGR